MTDAPEVSLPEGDILEEAAAPAKKPLLSPGMKFGALIVGAMLTIGVGMFYTSMNQVVGESKVPHGAELDSTPGGEVQQKSQAYQDSVSRMNENRAKKAEELGVTAVPTPEAIMEEVDPVKEIKAVEIAPETVAETPPEEPKPAPKAERRILPKPPAPPSQPAKKAEDAGTSTSAGKGKDGEKEPENPYIARMVSQMGTVADTFKMKGMASASISATEDDQSASTKAAAKGASTGSDAMAEMVLRPGDVLYGETLTSVDSDTQSPVMVEITTGDFKGARLVGSFSTNRAAARLAVTFSNMTAADGTVYKINAVAVDGKSAETAVASDVKRRYVARYAPILAATFLSGYAKSAAEPEQTVVGTGDSAQVVTETATTRQNVMSGVAASVDAISSDIMDSAPKGPKIILTDGYPLAIMVVDPVMADATTAASTTQTQ